jgi:large subunit ribosomal protein L4
MSKLTVYDMSGSPVGDMEIADGLLSPEKGAQAVHDAIVAMQAGRRAGTASTLSKGQVAGSNKKPWRQKGTGRARAGLRQSPVWRGGGVAFGPHPRSYEQKVNKKVARLAFRHAFSAKLASEQVKVLDDLTLQAPKTKLVSAMLKGLGLRRGALIVVDKVEKATVTACRNLPDVELVAASEVNVYQLLRYPVLVISKAGVERIKARLGGVAGEAA